MQQPRSNSSAVPIGSVRLLADFTGAAGTAVSGFAGGAIAGVLDLAVAGVTAGRGSDSGAGIHSFMIPGGVGLHPDIATTQIPTRISIQIRTPEITRRMTIHLHPPSNTIRTIPIATLTETGSRQTARALRPRKIPRTWPCRFLFT